MSHLTAPVLTLDKLPALGLGVFDFEEIAAIGGPEPEQITLEAFGREIPEA